MKAPSDGLTARPNRRPRNAICTRPLTAGHVSRGAIWRTPSPGTRAQPDEPTCSSNRHRCQCRVPRRRERRPRHIAGVVSRVPCSSHSAQAFGADRNTYLKTTHQRERKDTPGQLTDRSMRNREAMNAEPRLRRCSRDADPADLNLRIFRWGHWGQWGHRANIELFGVHRRGQAGDKWGQVAGTCTSSPHTGAAMSPFVPTSDWVRGDAETRVVAGVPIVPSCPRMFSAACMRLQKSSLTRRRPTCS